MSHQQNQPSRGGITSDQGILINPTQAQFNQVERQLRQAVLEIAVNRLPGSHSRGDLRVRDLLPWADLTSGADNGWTTATHKWEQSGMTPDALNETYTVDTGSGNQAEDKVIGIMAVSNNAGTPGTTALEFEDETATFLELELDTTFTDEEVLGLLTDPVVYPNEDGAISQWTEAAADELVLHGAVCEPKSQTYTDGNYFLSNKNQLSEGQ